MKSTVRMLGGYKAHRTRLLNNLRDRAWEALREISIGESGWVPTISRLDNDGVELWYDLGSGLRQVNFESRDKARDYVLSLFCH
ncbi:unnamed protein product [marine sediment metagenome]|uniref:Uncharacterized protein n=1 Tax=marine sediment metagenome TaxID=412755 RepID=X1JQ44_9ZZZZ